MFIFLGGYICQKYLNIRGGFRGNDSGHPLTTYCKFTAKRFRLRGVCDGLVTCLGCFLPFSHYNPDLKENALVFSALVAEYPCVSMCTYSIYAL